MKGYWFLVFLKHVVMVFMSMYARVRVRGEGIRLEEERGIVCRGKGNTYEGVGVGHVDAVRCRVPRCLSPREVWGSSKRLSDSASF